MGQTPKLDSLRTDAQLAAITAQAPSGTKDDREKSIVASAKYKAAKNAYDQAPKPTQPPKNVPTQKNIPSYKKGGMVHKTGLARLHKGERVIPTSKVHKVEKAMRKVSRKRG